MTMLACTITKLGAVISADSLMYKSDPLYEKRVADAVPTRDFSDAVKSCYPGGGDPASVTILGHVFKITPEPRFRMAVAVTGPLQIPLQMLTAWSLALTALPTCDITALNRYAPPGFRDLRDAMQMKENVIVVHAGYSERRQAGVGFVYSAADDFTPQEIHVGETLAAPADPEDPEIEAIRELDVAAKQGERIKELHVALFRQQQRSYLAGRMGVGAAVGGDLNTVVVGPDKIMIETAA